MTLIDKLTAALKAVQMYENTEAETILMDVVKDLHLNTLYPDSEQAFKEQLALSGFYKDTMGRLKQIPVEQLNECVHLCSCCKVIE